MYRTDQFYQKYQKTLRAQLFLWFYVGLPQKETCTNCKCCISLHWFYKKALEKEVYDKICFKLYWENELKETMRS